MKNLAVNFEWRPVTGLSAASLRGVCEVVRDVMGMKKDSSGREETLKGSLRKAGSIQELKALIKEARKTGSRSDWRVAEMGVLNFFGGRRCYLGG